MPNYTPLVEIESSSSPGHFHTASTDDDILTCDCNAWTRSTHSPDCPRVRGVEGTCRCRTLHSSQRPLRTCPHVRLMEPIIERMGGLVVAARLAQNNTLDMNLASWQAYTNLPQSSHTPATIREMRRPATIREMRRLLQELPPTRQRGHPPVPRPRPAQPAFTQGQHRHIRIRDDD